MNQRINICDCCKGFSPSPHYCDKPYCERYEKKPETPPPPPEQITNENHKLWSRKHFRILEECEQMAEAGRYEDFLAYLEKMNGAHGLQLKMIERWLYHGARYDQALTDKLLELSEVVE